MVFTIQDVYHFLDHRQVQLGMNFGLTRMERLLEKIDQPHKGLKFIHLAGSNGKGSTLHYIKEILITEGVKVGSFTSPFLEVMNEQLQVNGEPISNEKFVSIFQQLSPIIQKMDEQGNGPTQFEILTTMAFLYFKQAEVDYVLMEVGLGGRLDSTNVIDPLLSIITSISFEHTNILGNTLAEIAREKAGIIKQGKPIISGVLEKEALAEICEQAAVQKSPYFQLNRDIMIENISESLAGQMFSIKFRELELHDLKLQMLGKHQIHNAALAVAAAIILGISEQSIRAGLHKAKWNGRFEKLSDNPLIIIDGAHNPASMRTLMDTLTTYYPNYRYRFVFSALRDKDYAEMLNIINEVAAEVIITEFEHERAASVDELFIEADRMKNRVVENWECAIKEVIKFAKENEMIIITGSLYFLSVVKNVKYFPINQVNDW